MAFWRPIVLAGKSYDVAQQSINTVRKEKVVDKSIAYDTSRFNSI